jgi:CDP-glucose 4,6-dehydratase
MNLTKVTAEYVDRLKADQREFNFFANKNIGIATARAGNVIGGGDWSPNRLIPDVIAAFSKNKEVFLRRPNFNRPWQHVLEPISGYLILGYKLFNKPKKYSGGWNFGSKKNTVTTVHEVVKKIVKYWGGGKVNVSKKISFYEQENLQLNILKAYTEINWKPKYSIDKSVKETVEWYKKVFCGESAEKITEKQIFSYME